MADDVRTTPVLDDDRLADLLGQALRRADPPPEPVLAGARSAYTWRTIDVELAELVFDTSRMPSGVRASAPSRQVTFTSSGVEIELTVIDNGARRLVGQLVPPSAATVELVDSSDVRRSQADDRGRFSFRDVAPGPLRLVVRDIAAGRTIQTEILF